MLKKIIASLLGGSVVITTLGLSFNSDFATQLLAKERSIQSKLEKYESNEGRFISEYNKLHEGATKSIESLKIQIAQHKEQIGKLESQNGDNELLIKSLEVEVADLESMITLLEKNVADIEKSINKSAPDIQNEIDRLNDEVKKANTFLTDLETIQKKSEGLEPLTENELKAIFKEIK